MPRSTGFAAALAVLAVAQAASATIIDGPFFYQGHTYYLLDNASWTASEQEAITLGGHLVTVNDGAENAWLRSTFVTGPGRTIGLWLGLTDRDVEGTFVWTSGDPVGYTNWFAGEPNNFPFNDPVNGEDFGMMFGSGFWNDTDDLGQDQAPLHGVVELPFLVPEPEPWALLWTGLGLLAVSGRARRSRSPRAAPRCTSCPAPWAASAASRRGRAPGRRRARR